MPENKLVRNIYINLSYLSQELAFAYISSESCKTSVFNNHFSYRDQPNISRMWDSASDGWFEEG